ncbi:MAG: short-chain dehydrogenase [Proteobacteria bacterium SG_bin9]|nr:MAG: short-chain dehydrogenase [Proteobacteria bacterium SG_bin9]
MSRSNASFVSQYGPWAVVTGASNGIGRAFAIELAKRGFALVLVARNLEALEALATELETRHRTEVRIIAQDLQPEGAADALSQDVADLDVGLLVSAAGFGSSGEFVKSDLAEEVGMVDVNCRATVTLARLMAPRMITRGKGGLVLMSSLLAFQGTPRSANYAATKAFVQTFAEGLYHELKPLGVDVVACAPGPISSGFAARADMQMSMSEKPDVVAAETLDALGRRLTVRPGWLSKFLEFSLCFLPRWGRVRMMGVVMGGMTRHQRGKKIDQNTQPA